MACSLREECCLKIEPNSLFGFTSTIEKSNLIIGRLYGNRFFAGAIQELRTPS
jgi:hypothetical protein